jgi:prepilin-type N-terminal cleavage/methylation domain-containing protein
MMTIRRSAFSLIELLTVVAIVGVLLGLLLPAIQQIRASSLKIACQNQIKQLGLAFHGYQNQNGLLPPGLESDQPSNLLPYLNWHARLLPHLEHATHWQQILDNYKTERDFLKPPHRLLASTDLSIFMCPADGRSNRGGHKFAGLTSYLGNGGRNAVSADGVLYLDSRLRWDDITDGLSNTLLIGERPANPDLTMGWWYAGWGQDQDGSGDSVLGVREINFGSPYGRGCEIGPYRFRGRQINDSCGTFHFWSVHAGGAHFACADGSVRFLLYAADPLLPVFATRAGGDNESLP